MSSGVEQSSLARGASAALVGLPLVSLLHYAPYSMEQGGEIGGMVQYDPTLHENDAIGKERQRTIASPLGKITITGFDAVITGEQIAAFQKRHPTEDVALTASFPSVDGSSTGLPKKQLFHSGIPPETLHVPVAALGERLTFTVFKRNAKVTQTKTPPLVVPETTCADGSGVASFQQIAQSYTMDLCAVDALYSPFMHGKSPNYVVAPEVESVFDNSYVWDTGNIAYNAIRARGKADYALDKMVFVHEQAHGVLNLEVKDSDKVALRGAYNNLGARAQEMSPAQAALTESTYANQVEGEPTYVGHIDNIDEMFASTTDVIRTFPDGLLSRIRRLPLKDVIAINRVVTAVTDAYKNVNTNVAALRQLLPSLGSVRQALQERLFCRPDKTLPSPEPVGLPWVKRVS